MEPKEKRTHLVKLRFTPPEYEKLLAEMKEANYKEVAVYLRKKLTLREDKLIYNPREALNALEVLGTEVMAIGKNINQIARYVNYLKANNSIKPHVLEQYTVQLKALTELELSMQKTVRGFFREGSKKIKKD